MGKLDTVRWTSNSISNAKERPPIVACFGFYPKICTANKFIYKAAMVGDDLEKPEVCVVKARRFRPGTETYWQGELDQNRYATEMAVIFTDTTLAAKIDFVDQYLAPLNGYKAWDKVCLKMKPSYFRRLLKCEIVLIENAVRKLQLLNGDKVLEAFSHFTYSQSNGQNLLHSFKGSKTIDGKYLLLTPEMLSHKYDIHKWFQKHTCNNICEKFKTPIDTSRPDKPDIDIGKDAMLYDFNKENMPFEKPDSFLKDVPEDNNGKKGNLETTFGAKSCDWTYSIVTAIIHAEESENCKEVPVTKSYAYSPSNISNMYQENCYSGRPKQEPFNDKQAEMHWSNSDCLDGVLHFTDSTTCDISNLETEQEYLDNAILVRNENQNETNEFESIDYDSFNSGREASTLVIREVPYCFHEINRETENLVLASHDTYSAEKVEKEFDDNSLNVVENCRFINTLDKNIYCDTQASNEDKNGYFSKRETVNNTTDDHLDTEVNSYSSNVHTVEVTVHKSDIMNEQPFFENIDDVVSSGKCSENEILELHPDELTVVTSLVTQHDNVTTESALSSFYSEIDLKSNMSKTSNSQLNQSDPCESLIKDYVVPESIDSKESHSEKYKQSILDEMVIALTHNLENTDILLAKKEINDNYPENLKNMSVQTDLQRDIICRDSESTRENVSINNTILANLHTYENVLINPISHVDVQEIKPVSYMPSDNCVTDDDKAKNMGIPDLETSLVADNVPEKDDEHCNIPSSPDFLIKYNLQTFVDASELEPSPIIRSPKMIESGCSDSFDQQHFTQTSYFQDNIPSQKPKQSSLRSGRSKHPGKSVKFAEDLNGIGSEYWVDLRQTTGILQKSPNIASAVSIPVHNDKKSFQFDITNTDLDWYTHIPCECCDHENITGRD